MSPSTGSRHRVSSAVAFVFLSCVCGRRIVCSERKAKPFVGSDLREPVPTGDKLYHFARFFLGLLVDAVQPEILGGTSHHEDVAVGEFEDEFFALEVGIFHPRLIALLPMFLTVPFGHALDDKRARMPQGNGHDKRLVSELNLVVRVEGDAVVLGAVLDEITASNRVEFQGNAADAIAEVLTKQVGKYMLEFKEFR